MTISRPILIWDWDGTLVDSLQFKYEDIWDDVFPNEPEKSVRAKGFIQTPEGKAVNRYGLIHYAVTKSVPELKQLSDDALKKHPVIKEYADRYDRAAKRQIERDGLFLGVKEMLERLFEDGYSMYIVSGGGTDDTLRDMAEDLGVGKYIRGFFGFGAVGTSLTSFGKRENFHRVMEFEQDTDSSHYIVIGDGESDKTFAKSIGAAFIGIANTWNAWRADGVSIIASATDVEDVLNSVYQK